jgi:hypothetical protein
MNDRKPLYQAEKKCWGVICDERHAPRSKPEQFRVSLWNNDARDGKKQKSGPLRCGRPWKSSKKCKTEIPMSFNSAKISLQR